MNAVIDYPNSAIAAYLLQKGLSAKELLDKALNRDNLKRRRTNLVELALRYGAPVEV